MATSNGADQATLKSQLKIYDYQVLNNIFTFLPLVLKMYAAPVDFTAKNSPKLYGISEFSIADSQPLGNPLNVIRNVVSWVAVHTFGKRLLFPGALSLMNFAVNPALVDGRRKYTTEYV